MTLALLLTAVTGAWAEETPLVTINASSEFKSGSKTFDNKVTVTFSNEVAFIADNGWCAVAAGNKTLTVEPVDGVTITRVKYYTTLGNAEDITAPFEAIMNSSYVYVSGNPQPCFHVSVNGSRIGAEDTHNYLQRIEVYGTAEPPIKVTTNAAEGETTFTEAWFNMPANDVTAEYELVRDMSVQMTATMGDGTDGLRYRVKKAQQGEGYEPADMNMMQVLALVAVNDGIEQKDLTLNQDYYCRIYKLDEQTLQPEGDGVKLADFDFAPGLYALKAFANDGSNYDGETALSNTFQLFQGYEITVPAGEFITYYKDEPLRIEDQEADLYTIQSVSADQAVLSSPSDAMPALTPMLIYNKSQQEKVILLIPCAEPDLAITVAPEFQGTLTGTTIAASTEGQTNYAFNGKAFVFVKNDLAIGANKAWLSVNTGEPSARITLVFDDATGVNGVIGVKEVNDGSWYDLNGRKLDKMPTKKGVYLFNGKKVVVK